MATNDDHAADPRISLTPKLGGGDVTSTESGRWYAAGERGALLISNDDGRRWSEQVTPIGEDLYAVNFFDGALGMAVGAHGAAIMTSDGGDTWRNVSTGLDVFLGDVVWMSKSVALVVGEGGLVLRYTR